MTDSDHAGNHEVQNRRRSQNGLVMTINGAPYFWQSKASSVAFASEAIGEAHADMSSGAVEIYAAGNATLDIMGIKYVAEEMGFDFQLPSFSKWTTTPHAFSATAPLLRQSSSSSTAGSSGSRLSGIATLCFRHMYPRKRTWQTSSRRSCHLHSSNAFAIS